MTGGPPDEPLPASVGGIIDLSFAAYAERAPLYLALAAAVLVAGVAVEVAIPGAALGTPRGDAKLVAFEYVSLAGDAFVVAAVATGVGMRVARSALGGRTVLDTAARRWLAVVGASIIVQFVVDVMRPLSGFGPLPDPAAIALVTAPLTWLAWGALGLAAPIAALGEDRPALAIVTSVARAVGIAFARPNLGRLAVLAFISIVPSLIESIAFDLLAHAHVAHAVFWAAVPIDAAFVGPLAALQTVFALDFGRRAAGPPAPR